MATLKIETGSDEKVWVSLTRFSAEDLARMKQIPGRQWNPEGKQWSLPDNAVTRNALAEIVALPPAPSPKFIAVKPKNPDSPPATTGKRKKYVPGRDKPLTTNPPHPLIKEVDDELVLLGRAYGTRKSYGQHLRNYFKWLGGDAGQIESAKPEQATREQIRGFLISMGNSGLASASYCRQAWAAMIFLYRTVLKQPEKVRDLPVVERPSQLPIVLSREEVVRLFRVTNNLKHKTILSLAYSAGLRVGEVVRLKANEIDLDRMKIRITQSKGAKDRYAILSEKIAVVLRAYLQAYRPKDWLFSGEDPKDHLSVRSAEHIFEHAKVRAGIKKPATFHTLRHSFATHMLEDGVDTRYIMELMGHESIETTERYTHVTEKGIARIKSPLDNINFKEVK